MRDEGKIGFPKALQALKSSLKPESRVLGILEKEVEWLQGERRQLEAHLIRTEIWGENLGKWRAVVQTAEVGTIKNNKIFIDTCIYDQCFCF